MEPIRSLSAITLAVADMAASLEFYGAAGFAMIAGGPGEAFTTLRAGSSFLNLQLDQEHAPIPRIWGRAIFWVDDVDAMYERIRASGFEPSMPPADAPWGERYFHVHDPDGHEISFARPS